MAPTTYRSLLHYVPPSAPEDLSTQNTTESYRFLQYPAPKEVLELSAPDSAWHDDPFWRRAIAALEARLGSRLDDALPLDALTALAAFENECENCPIEDEDETKTMLDLLAAVARACVKDLAPGCQCSVAKARKVHSVYSDGLLTNVAVSRTQLRSTAVERMAPSVLRKLERDLCGTPRRYSICYYPDGAESILYNLYLLMSQGTERVGIIYGVHYVVFVEKEDWVGPEGDRKMEHCLRVSKMHSCFLPASGDEREPVPLVAVMLSLCFPGVEIPAARDAGKFAVSDEVIAANVEGVSPFVYQDIDPVDVRRGQRSTSQDPGSTLERRKITERPPGVPESFIIMARPSPSWFNASGAMRLRLRQYLHKGPDAQTCLLEGPNAALYVAKLFESGNQFFEREFHAITTVRKRCGDITPRVLGQFRGKEANILLQEYGGSCLSSDLDKLALADRLFLWTLIKRLHEAHIAHRDLEPRNVLRGSEGVLRLVDFGCANLQHRCPGLELCGELRDMGKLLGQQPTDGNLPG